MNKRHKIVSQTVRTIVVWTIALICAVPLYYVVISSFKTPIDMIKHPLQLPTQWLWNNYIDAFADGTIIQAFINTIIVTAVAVILQVLIGSLAAYGVVQKKSLFTMIIGSILMITFAIPVQATLLPLYRMESSIGLTDTLTGLVALYMGSCVFCYFLIVGYMKALPQELFEAAKIDGAGPFRIYWTIVLPLIRPIIVAVVVFQTMGTWNDFLLPSVFLSSTDKQTVVLQVYNAVQQFTTKLAFVHGNDCISFDSSVYFLLLLPEVDSFWSFSWISKGLNIYS